MKKYMFKIYVHLYHFWLKKIIIPETAALLDAGLNPPITMTSCNGCCVSSAGSELW